MKLHPTEEELAHLSDGEPGEGVAEHVRRCVRCRNATADYRWLEGELGATLAAVAGAVPVPRPRWRVVWRRMVASQRRQVAARWASACASLVLMTTLMFATPILAHPRFLALAAAQAARPQAVMVPAPKPAVSPGTARWRSPSTPTPIVCAEETTPKPTPALMLPPTPPEEVHG